ncbi:MAG: hypothetical protein R8G66_09425 [Cytophagales bacterium]|nr:hypothetical protein [Cytophagales bacterium]
MKTIFSNLLSLAILAMVVMSCSDDEPAPIVPDAGTLVGGPFTFQVDGVVDNVSGITVEGEPVGTNSSFVVTDDQNNILGLPGDLAALEGVDFDAPGVGVCFIWYIRYEDDLTGLEQGESTNNLDGTFDLSNSIMVNRTNIAAATLTGGPFNFVVDGTADNVSGITVEGGAEGLNTSFVVTDAENNILGLPGDVAALEGVDFDGAGAGVCLIWHVTYGEGLTGLDVGNNVSGLSGNFALSNSVTVNRAGAGELAGGPFTFIVDGTTDNVSGITVSNNLDLTNTGYIVTDDMNNILGLPPTLEAVEGVDFDGAGAGVCYIWRITYEDGLMGLTTDGGNVDNLEGTFSVSNGVRVNRISAGTLAGGPFSFLVDGTADNVSGITVSMNQDLDNTGYIITDDMNNILGLPPTLEAVEGVDFDGAGAGICYIWRITYAEGLTGLTTDQGNVDNLEGTFSISNGIRVTRSNAGMLAGGPFTFIVDGTADNVSGITVSDNQDLTNSGWVITDDSNNILGLPPTLDAVEGVDFDAAGSGVCYIWRITYEDDLTGLMTDGGNVDNLTGTYSLSNGIRVTRASAGTLAGGPFTFTVDGTVDNVSGISVSGNQDLTNTGYVVTDDQNNILGLPGTLEALEGVDFDAAGTGVCLIWRITYEDGLMGLTAGENTSGISGTFSLSNSITVTRN